MKLYVQVDGEAGLNELMIRLTSELDTEAILDEAAAILLNRIRDRFLDQVDPEGNLWPESAAARRRASLGVGGGTLFDTGRLFHSIQLYASGEGSREIGTDVPYAPYHQFGTSKLPRRQFLGFSDDDSEKVVALIVKRIRRAVNEQQSA